VLNGCDQALIIAIVADTQAIGRIGGVVSIATTIQMQNEFRVKGMDDET
jgi:hypothetical protein